MKTHHTKEQLQAAIDAACKITANSTHRPSFALLRLIESNTTDDWPKETSARLHLLKTALALLPEPPPPVVDGKTPGEVHQTPMKHKYPIGAWVRFYQDRSIVIAVIQYLPKMESWEREPSYHTDKGPVVESEILEARSE